MLGQSLLFWLCVLSALLSLVTFGLACWVFWMLRQIRRLK